MTKYVGSTSSHSEGVLKVRNIQITQSKSLVLSLLFLVSLNYFTNSNPVFAADGSNFTQIPLGAPSSHTQDPAPNTNSSDSTDSYNRYAAGSAGSGNRATLVNIPLWRQTLGSLPFIRYFSNPCVQPTWRLATKALITDVSIISGAIGFHYIFPPYDQEPCPSSGDHQAEAVFFQCGDPSGQGQIADFQTACKIPQNTTGIYHQSFSCHIPKSRCRNKPKTILTDFPDHVSHGNDSKAACGDVDIDFGQLFVGMELGIATGQLAAIWINRVIVDSLFDCVAGPEDCDNQ